MIFGPIQMRRHAFLLKNLSSLSPRTAISTRASYHANRVTLSHLRRTYSKTQPINDHSSFPCYFDTSTIYALSTASGKAGIAIVRVSGPACLDVYRSLCPARPILKHRHASVRTIYDPTAPTNVLDTEALVLHFPAPKTVTGEDVLELHIHGGPATVKAILAAIPKSLSTSSIRYAEPGEFTRRAFQNNRLDLAQVEALSDALSAETEQQRRAAVRGSASRLGQTYDMWRRQLLDARGEMEAIIDFSEDQNFEESNEELLQGVTATVISIMKSLKKHNEASQRGELVRNGVRISLLGPPNAGKSSLLNRIVGREASIVSTEVGTTRDVIEVAIDLKGYLCVLADTAGLRASIAIDKQGTARDEIPPAVEAEGIRRAKLTAENSDLVLVLASIELVPDLSGWEIRYDHEAVEIGSKARRCIVVVNKIDRVPESILHGLRQSFQSTLRLRYPKLGNFCVAYISCLDNGQTGDNLTDLMTALEECLQQMTEIDQDDLHGVTARQSQLLIDCSGHLARYIDEATRKDTQNEDIDIVLAAEHLRGAAVALARITGQGEGGDVEEVLGVVFEKFCVGK